MAGRNDALSKCELRNFIRFLQAEGWFADNDKRICFLSNFTGRRKAILTPGDVFIHDNTRPHNAVVTQQLLEQFKWCVSDHPAYSPDLATSDFHFFPVLKN
ncbi:hypothetical protein AVEN_64386-1 [Araneus ventricosus]|uniref:Histone-lysine N-methyltransferase SETMAR n=1 Tax=Araneus ventricosus TaxID=182803 RepID=A0A4Y2GCX7_ARAVE|nr:hypothetical protein AVEN_64386-1 [Araneus ventricosus]